MNRSVGLTNTNSLSYASSIDGVLTPPKSIHACSAWINKIYKLRQGKRVVPLFLTVLLSRTTISIVVAIVTDVLADVARTCDAGGEQQGSLDGDTHINRTSFGSQIDRTHTPPSSMPTPILLGLCTTTGNTTPRQRMALFGSHRRLRPPRHHRRRCCHRRLRLHRCLGMHAQRGSGELTAL